MTLISILLALIIERLAAKEDCWQLATYAEKYLTLSKATMLNKLFSAPVGFIVWLSLPGLALYYIAQWFDFVLIELALNVAVLLICLGCSYYRDKYKGYLNALQRQDTEAATLYAMQLGQNKTEEEGGETLGQTLAWINFRYYGAVIFWFVIFGLAGALTYSLVRTFLVIIEQDEQSSLVNQTLLLKRIQHFLNWLPARVISLGYLIIGNFTQGTSYWLKHAFDFKVANRTVVSEIASATEKVEEQFIGCSYEAKCMVRLVKRNMLFLMAVIAMLTLFGFIG